MTAPNANFLRRVELQIQAPGGPARTLSGLRVLARARRSLTQTPDASTFSVFGPAPGSVQDLQTPGCVVRVLAGYRDDLACVLSGTVRPATLDVVRQSGEVVASAEVVDARVEVRQRAVSRAWDQALASEVIAWAIGAAGLARGTVRLGTDIQYVRGFTALGVVGDVLTQLAEDTGSTLTIQDGVVSFVPAGEQKRASSLLISPTSGLIGSPRRMDEGKVEAVCLLAPTLRPGDGYRVQGVDLAGDYRAIDVEIDIDSREGPFYTRIVGAPL